MLRSCDSYVQASFIDQEAQGALKARVIVASDAVENNDFFLPALEGINRIYLDSVLESLTLLPTDRPKLVLQSSYLRLVWRDDPNLSFDAFQTTLFRSR